MGADRSGKGGGNSELTEDEQAKEGDSELEDFFLCYKCVVYNDSGHILRT